MKNDFTYCTIQYKHCKKQRECKLWIGNYDEEILQKASHDSNIWPMDGLNCVNSGYDNFINKDKE